MPAIRLTDLSVSKLNAEKQTRFTDVNLPGFGVLVGKRRKTFFVMNGKERTLRTLGPYPALSLQNARRAALAIIDGTDTIQAAQRPEERIDEYVHQLQATPKWKYEQARILKRYLLPKCSDLTTITKKDILSITDALRETPSEMLHCHRALKAFFSYCTHRDYVPSSPLQALPMPASQKSRERTLTDDELRRVWNASKQMGQFGQVIRLAVLTGQRKGQLAKFKPEWIDLHRAGIPAVFFPASAMKAARDHVTPVTPTALKLFQSLKVDFVAWGKLKSRLDTLANVSGYTIHDLRRDWATRAASIGIEPHLIQRVLAHSPGSISGVTAIYDRYRYISEIALAYRKYEVRLAEILGEPLHS